MNTRKIAFAALAVATALSAGLAQARGPVDVQWQLNIGVPLGVYPVQGGVVLSSPAYAPAPVYSQAPMYSQAPVYFPAPVVMVPRYAPVYREPARWDVDGDGIPNRYDRVYNPRWDRNGDGVPDRYRRHDHHGHREWRDERRGHDGQDWRDGYDNRSGHRDGR